MTTCRYRIVHTSSYHYTAPVSASHNEVRMTPLTEPGQTTLESRLRIRPLSWSTTYRDYWGTHVTALETSGLHEALVLEAISTVERDEIAADCEPVTWESLRAAQTRDLLYEYLQTRPRTDLPAEVVEAFAAPASGLDPAATVEAVVEAIGAHLDYEAGVTEATTAAADAWAAGKGVCQDFVHVTLGALRGLGVPARYVSGYLMPDADAPLGTSLAAESHAWVEWWDGRAWCGIDPTNRRPVGLGHITVARGRDYEDVAPFKGVYLGDAEADLTVTVTITRLS
ncbi:MAG: transglutaminase family protein [Propioniciclava sp.]|uniref:transglutaminase family protein n=1 Tax=Propioniciclava sp. TaxID=2038686 RepID=UPI0039E3A0BF